MLSFEHLSPAEFESLCFDLIVDIGAESADWRKGTTGDSSPSDQGRDIECHFRYTGPGGEALTERRFVECKHYARGVPPSELHAALAWAHAERPDALYFIVSGFLSNPAKAFLEQYRQNNRPNFRIAVWEQPRLTSYLISRSRLLRKYRLTGPLPQLELLHPVHVRWLTEAPVFGTATLFDVLDRLAAGDREEFLDWAMLSFTDFKLRPPRTGRESLHELMDVHPSYETFRAKCLALPLGDEFIAASVVEVSLAAHLRIADITRADEIRERCEGFIQFLERRRGELQERSAHYDEMIARQRRELDGIEPRLKRNHERYVHFCERVLLSILEAPPEPVSLPPEWDHVTP